MLYRRHTLALLALVIVVAITHHAFSVISPSSHDADVLSEKTDLENGSRSWGAAKDWSGSMLGRIWTSNQQVQCPQLPPLPTPERITNFAATEAAHKSAEEADDEESDEIRAARLGHPLAQKKQASTAGPTSVWSPKGTSEPFLETKVIKHAPGWTIFENLYMAGGTFFVVTDEDKSKFPETRMMISTPLEAINSPENIAAREPTDKQLQFVKLKDAEAKWRGRVWPVVGMTFFLNDPKQFLSHYYHFVAETLMGLWRMFSWLDPTINVQGEMNMDPPARLIFGWCHPEEWRDYSTFNHYILHGAFPSMSIETARDWEGRSKMTETTLPGAQKVWRFNHVIISDRSSAFRGNFAPGRNQRIAAEAWEATKQEASKWWWEPVRRSVLRFSGVPDKTIDLPAMWSKEWNTVGNGDEKPNQQQVQAAMSAHKRMPIVVSYIVRNGNRRSLIKEDHEGLVKALDELCKVKNWEFNVVHAERLSKEEQIQVAARTTIMLGIHGNGLTHLVWMPLTPLSTVIEIFIPKGFAKDYEWTARSLGMRHYAVWNDTYFTHPNEPKVDYPDGFQGNQIPAHGPFIAKLIEDRIEGRLP